MSSNDEVNLNTHLQKIHEDSIFTIRENENLPKSQMKFPIKESNKFQYIAAVLASFSWFLAGNVISWTSPSLSLMMKHNPPLITSSETSWLAAQLPLGEIFSCFLIRIVIKHFGRKFSLLTSVIAFLLSYTVLLAANDILMLYAGRLISGYGVATCSMACSLYIGEISEKDIRGRLLMLISFMNSFGSVVCLSIGPFVTYHNFLAILSPFPVLFFATFIFMPESPYFKVQKGDIDGAKESIAILYGTKDELTINKKLKSIEQSVEFDMDNKGSYWELVSNAKSRKSMLILLGMKTVMQLSAITAINTYIQPIFIKTETSISSEMIAIATGVIQMGVGLGSYYFIDTFGRKPLLVTSMVGCIISLFGAGAYFFVTEYLQKNDSDITWLALCSIMMLVALEPMGIGSLGTVFLGELFPINQKENAGTIATTYSSVMGFIVIKLFGVAIGNDLLYIAFFGCAVLLVFGLLFAIYFTPETKKKSLHEIQVKVI